MEEGLKAANSTDKNIEVSSSTKNPKEVKPPMANEKIMKPSRYCHMVDCKRRLPLMTFPCRCGKTFCVLHKPPEEHKCQFDYHAAAKRKIKKDNPKIVAEKIKKL